jgi:probable biosynthetic protein (TIGR04098 family)
MSKYLKLIKSIAPDIDATSINSPIVNTSIDSMDLLTIRVELENMIGKQITDSQWVRFNTLQEIFEFCDGQAWEIQNNVSYEDGYAKKIKINMPQMALEALSENWFFKEMGDIHWDLLCRGLNTESMQLKDEMGNRLYATFTRIRIEATDALNQFLENESCNITGKIERFGNGMYFSNYDFEVANKKIRSTLMSSFSIRNDTDNTKLLKSQPSYQINTIVEAAHIPDFANEYRLLKKEMIKSIVLKNVIFNLSEHSLFTTTYTLNPYYDLNGVGLLYFAAYPIINNKCEADFFNTQNPSERWETTYHTLARDIFYYANCNINDTIKYVLNDYEVLDNNIIKTASSLYRCSDDKLMAKIFTLKKKK